MSTKKVSLLTAEDIGTTVETTGYVRTKAIGWRSYEDSYSEEVRLRGRLDSFRPLPITPNAVVTPTRPRLPEGYELTIGGVRFHVPAKFVVTIGTLS